MQGLSKKQHEQLIGALFKLEHLLKQRDADVNTMLQAESYRLDLNRKMDSYIKLVNEIMILISDYHDLYNEAKVKFLGTQLKKMKREISELSYSYTLLQKNIHQAYNT